ncbi:HAMP domain-containing protein [bacterium]|nr:HAMP domain-containing protein [bacterium]
MSWLNNIKMKPKLTSLFLIIGLIPLVIVALVGINKSSTALETSAKNQLTAIQTVKAGQVERFFNERMGDISVLSHDPTVILGADRMFEAYRRYGMDSDSYREVSEDIGPFLTEYEKTYGYYDVFLINPDGDIVWTVEKESDLGQNIPSSSLSRTSIATAFSKGKSQPSFADFGWYEPSNDAASFVAAPLKDRRGKLIGVLAFQVPLDSINTIMQERAGMGETGETYLVGSDKRMRSDSYLDPEGHSVQASFAGTVEKNGVDTEAVNAALAGKEGCEVIIDYNGNPVYSAYSKIQLPGGVTWVCLAEIDEAEVKAPVRALSTSIIIIALIIAAIIGVVAYAIAGTMANPITKVTHASQDIARGDLNSDININQRDEVGMLADAFHDMQVSLRDKAKAAKEIAAGNLQVDIQVASNADDLAKSMVTMRDRIKQLIAEMNHMSDEHDKGDIDVVIPIDKFDGAFRTMAKGVNDMVNGHITVKKKAMACVAEFGKGNFDAPLEKFPGKKAFINDIIEQVRANLKAVMSDLDNLANAALEGRLNTRADARMHHGDFQKIVAGVNDLLDAVIKPVQEASAVLEKMSQGDLRDSVTGEYKGDHAMIKNSMNGTLESLNEILSQVLQSVEQVSASAHQVSDSSQSLSQGATEQASSLEQVTSTVTELTSQTNQNAENAQQANTLAETASDSASKGNRQMEKMLEAMNKITQSSNEISQIIKTIDEIAFQTNLLALNAAVEAARAGVHGKGFAVVAEEVRNLAQRSATAARETTELIEGSIKRVENGTSIADETAVSLREIIDSIKKVNDIVGEIASASREQAEGLRQVSDAMGQIDQVTQGNTANAEESASAAEELSGQSVQLREMVSRFTLRNGHHAISGSVNTKKMEMRETAMLAPAESDDDVNGGWIDLEE